MQKAYFVPTAILLPNRKNLNLLQQVIKNAPKGQPMEQREQCEHAQTLPNCDRGRRSQKQSAQGIALGRVDRERAHCFSGDSFAPVLKVSTMLTGGKDSDYFRNHKIKGP